MTSHITSCVSGIWTSLPRHDLPVLTTSHIFARAHPQNVALLRVVKNELSKVDPNPRLVLCLPKIVIFQIKLFFGVPLFKRAVFFHPKYGLCPQLTRLAKSITISGRLCTIGRLDPSNSHSVYEWFGNIYLDILYSLRLEPNVCYNEEKNLPESLEHTVCFAQFLVTKNWFTPIPNSPVVTSLTDEPNFFER